jgi:hypothetical protein
MKPVTSAKKILIVFVVAVLLALDWAALHDIIKGEENAALEYIMILFSIAAFGLLIFYRIRTGKHRVHVA